MNELIASAAGARRRTPTGGVGRLSGASPREQLDGLMAAHADAQRAGDDAAAGYLDHQIESLLGAARAGGAQSRDPQTGQFVAEPAPSFDGGVRGTRLPAPPGGMFRPRARPNCCGARLRRTARSVGPQTPGSALVLDRSPTCVPTPDREVEAVSIAIENLPPYEQISSEPIREAAATPRPSAARGAADEAKKTHVAA